MSKAKNGAKSRQQLDRAARFTGRWQLGLDQFSSLLYPIFPALLPSSICLCHCSLLQQLRIKQRSCMSLQMMHGRPCASRCSSSSSSLTMMQAAQPPKQSHNPLNGRSVPSSEPLAALALHLLLKKRHSRCHSVANTLTRTPAASSSVSSLQITEVSAERRRRALLDDALDRDKQLDRLNKEMSYWVDMGYTNSNLQYSLLMQNLGELEETTTATTTSLIDKELATLLERDDDTTLLVQHIDQLGPLKSFINSESVSVATLVDTLPTTTQTSSHESDCALLADEILKFDRPETHPMTRYREEEDDSTDDDDQVVIVRSGKSEERKLKRTRRASSEKGASGGTSVKVSKRKPRKSRKSSSSQFISDWKNCPGQRRSIVREQSALLVTIKECASLQKIREELIKQEGLEEVSYQRWAEAAGVDEAVLKSRLQEGYCCRERLLVTTEWLVKYIARSYRGMGTDFDDLLQVGKMGVLDGAEKFDSQKGCKFSTYVKYWIRKGMLALLAENSGVTLLPARMESIIRKVKEARRAIRHSAGRNPSDSEIATVVGVSVANVRLARKCSRRVVSLYTEIGLEQKANFAEVIPDTSAEAPDEAIFRSQLRERLLQVLDRLPDREGRVLKLRHGLEDGKCRSLEHIGGVYSVSKEWIRKIEKSAVAKLRNDDDVRRELDDFYRF